MVGRWCKPGVYRTVFKVGTWLFCHISLVFVIVCGRPSPLVPGQGLLPTLRNSQELAFCEESKTMGRGSEGRGEG